MRNEILKKIDELTGVYPNISIGYGFKEIDGKLTDDIGITFGVENKLPLSELSPEEVLPSEIVIDGQVYKTDVVKENKPVLLACTIPSSCYPYPDTNDPYEPIQNPSIPNRNKTRPLMGGIVIGEPSNYLSPNGGWGAGTLGFIALEKDSNAYVGVSNLHVLQGNEILAPTSKGISGSYSLNYSSVTFGGNTKPIIQWAFGVDNNPWDDVSNNIGKGFFSVRWKIMPLWNETDCAFTLLQEKDGNGVNLISLTESWKQIGLPEITSPPPFATTQELDEMMSPSSPYFNPEMISSGLATGPKNGACRLKIKSIYQTLFITGINNVKFRDAMYFTRLDQTCPNAVYSGDSGSALFAKFGGVWKIIGLVFAAASDQNPTNFNLGIACRIDRIAEQLNIKAWNGTGGRFANVNTISTKVAAGANNDATKVIGGKMHWQGMATNQPPTI